MQLLINEKQDQIQVDSEIKELLKRALETVLEGEAFSQEFIDAVEVSLVLTDDSEMAELNDYYRGVEGTTDVLSFPMMEDEPSEGPTEELLLGDIVISVPRAQAQAEEYGHSLARELVFLAVHGMLHLLGYDHLTEEEAAIMRAKEKKVMKQIGIGRFGENGGAEF
ncbi:MAG: rRNA maturation RNase YbeY [Thermacetogeniaceae bacterium]|nr:rRNA maturation RNase YbeY [Thermoanaerobacterales bacterium]NLN21554.1 rRNA maturation RNase YbeY [Syntrophomonadaceae bacterium]